MVEFASLLTRALSDVLPVLRSDPAELHQRLARAASPSLSRPPRAWCLAVRASDTRITPTRTLIEPEYAVEPLYRRQPLKRNWRRTRRLPVQSEIPPHTVQLTSSLLSLICPPVRIPFGLKSTEVAALLGVHPSTLLTARRKRILSFQPKPLLGGRHGTPVPTIDTSTLLDPSSASLRQPPDLFWLSLWQFQAYQIPPDIEQTVSRLPNYRNRRYPNRPAHSQQQFTGFTWLCPACHRPARTLY